MRNAPLSPETIAILALPAADRLRLAALLLDRGDRDLVWSILDSVRLALLRAEVLALTTEMPPDDPLRNGHAEDDDEADLEDDDDPADDAEIAL
jgi:hypothetical protein